MSLNRTILLVVVAFGLGIRADCRAASGATTGKKEVVLVAAIQAPIIADGKQIGSVKLPAGSSVTLVSIESDGVMVSRGDGMPFKVAKEAIAPADLAAAMATPTPPPVVATPQPAPTPVATSTPTPAPVAPPVFFDQLKQLLSAPYTARSPHYTAIYFSGHWCPGCREFTPKLVSWYSRFKPSHPDFDLVFFSEDKDEATMNEYMHSASMPWPALAFNKKGNKILVKYYPKAIPYLVLIDEKGSAITALPENKYVPPSTLLPRMESFMQAPTLP